MSVPDNIVLVENKLKVLAHIYFAQRKYVQALQLLDKKLKDNLGEDGLEEEFEVLKELLKTNNDFKKYLLDYATKLALNHPVYVDYLSRLKGAGKYSAFMLGLIPARRFETISKLWKYTGHAPPEVYSGQKKYHVMSKTLVHQVVESMIRSKSYYYQIYKSFREEEDREHPDLTPAHRHMRAMRKVKKLFLSHYWTMYRKILGLPIRLPYSIERGIEQTYIKPFIEKPKLEFIEI